MARIDIIVPVYNEGPALERFHAALVAVVSNGSKRESSYRIRSQQAGPDRGTIVARHGDRMGGRSAK